MNFIRTLVFCILAAALVGGCGPRNEDTDPKADELNLNIDEGDGGGDTGAGADKTAD